MVTEVEYKQIILMTKPPNKMLVRQIEMEIGKEPDFEALGSNRVLFTFDTDLTEGELEAIDGTMLKYKYQRKDDG